MYINTQTNITFPCLSMHIPAYPCVGVLSECHSVRRERGPSLSPLPGTPLVGLQSIAMVRQVRGGYRRQPTRAAKVAMVEKRKKAMGIGESNPFDRQKQHDKAFVSGARGPGTRNSSAATQSRLNERLRRAGQREAFSALREEMLDKNSRRNTHNRDTSSDYKREERRKSEEKEIHEQRGRVGSYKYNNSEEDAGLDFNKFERQKDSGLTEDMKEMRASGYNGLDRFERFKEAEMDPDDPWGARSRELRAELAERDRKNNESKISDSSNINNDEETTINQQKQKENNFYVDLMAKAEEFADENEKKEIKRSEERKSKLEIYQDIIEKSKKWRELRFLERQQIKDSIEDINEDFDITRQVMPTIEGRAEREAIKSGILEDDKALGDTSFELAVQNSKVSDLNIFGNTENQKVRATGKLLSDSEYLKRERYLLEKKQEEMDKKRAQERKEQKRKEKNAKNDDNSDDEIKESNFGEANDENFAPLPYELDPDFDMQSSAGDEDENEDEDENIDSKSSNNNIINKNKQESTKRKAKINDNDNEYEEAEEEDYDEEEEEEEEQNGEEEEEEEIDENTTVKDVVSKKEMEENKVDISGIPLTIDLPNNVEELESLLSQYSPEQELYIYDRIAKCNSTKVKLSNATIQESKTKAKEESISFAKFLEVLVERMKHVSELYDDICDNNDNNNGNNNEEISGDNLASIRTKLNNLQRIIKFVISDVPTVSVGFIKKSISAAFDKSESVLNGTRKPKQEGTKLLPLDRTDLIFLRFLVNTYKMPIKSENGLFIGTNPGEFTENIDYMMSTPQHNIYQLLHLLMCNIMTRMYVNTPESAVFASFLTSTAISSVNCYTNNINDQNIERFSESKNIIFNVYLPGIFRIIKLIICYVLKNMKSCDKNEFEREERTTLSLAMIPNNIEYIPNIKYPFPRICKGLMNSLQCMIKGLIVTYGSDSHFLLYPKLMSELLVLFKTGTYLVECDIWNDCIDLLESTIYIVTKRIVNVTVAKVLSREAVATTNEGDEGIKELEPDFELHYDPKDISGMGINENSTPTEIMRMMERKKRILNKKNKNERRHYEKELRQEAYMQQQAMHVASTANRSAADKEYRSMLSVLQKDAAEYNMMDRIGKEMKRGLKK